MTMTTSDMHKAFEHCFKVSIGIRIFPFLCQNVTVWTENRQIRLYVQPKNTINADKKWESVFKEFLSTNDMTKDFYNFDAETLNKWLSKLWFSARQKQTKKEIHERKPGKGTGPTV